VVVVPMVLSYKPRFVTVEYRYKSVYIGIWCRYNFLFFFFSYFFIGGIEILIYESLVNNCLSNKWFHVSFLLCIPWILQIQNVYYKMSRVVSIKMM